MSSRRFSLMLSLAILGSSRLLANHPTEDASVLFLDDLQRNEAAAVRKIASQPWQSADDLRRSQTAPFVRTDVQPASGQSENTAVGSPRNVVLQRLPSSEDADFSETGNQQPDLGDKPGRDKQDEDETKEGEELDASPPTLAGFSFQKVFARLDLLDEQSPLSSSVVNRSTFRNPYFGSQQTTEFSWAASNLAHKTLYFEDDPLERQGDTHSPLLQPGLSGIEFFKDLIASPFRCVFDGPHKCHFVAGQPRVGSCAPPLKERVLPCARR